MGTIKIGRLYHLAAIGTILAAKGTFGKLVGNNMKQIIASVFLYPCRWYNDFSQKFAAMSVSPSVSTQTSLSVLKLSRFYAI